MFLYVIIGILMFGFMIFIHELGHFLAAKKCNVGIYEFSIGMGPAILSRTGKDNVKYALRLLPIGGFVSMYGEDDDECPDDEKSLSKKSVWQRIFVVSAGAVMNIILGLVIATGLVIFGGDLYSTKIERFNFGDENGNLIPMEEYQGLEIGDEIVKVGSRHIFVRHDLVYEAMNIGNEPCDIVVKRDGEKVVIKDFVFPTSTESGVVFGNANFFLPTVLKKTPVEVIKQSFCQSVAVIRMIWTSLIDTFKGKYGTEAVSGPVGIVGEMKETASYGPSALFFLMMVITMNLGIFNLLPFPALDGGRLLFLVIELIRRKPINPKYEGYVHFAGLVILMALMVFVTFGDIMKLIK